MRNEEVRTNKHKQSQQKQTCGAGRMQDILDIILNMFYLVIKGRYTCEVCALGEL